MVFWYLSDSLSFYNRCSGKENMNSKLTFNFENLYVGVCYEQMPKLVSVRLLSDFMAQWYFAAHTISQLLTSKKVWFRGLWSHKKIGTKTRTLNSIIFCAPWGIWCTKTWIEIKIWWMELMRIHDIVLKNTQL